MKKETNLSILIIIFILVLAILFIIGSRVDELQHVREIPQETDVPAEQEEPSSAGELPPEDPEPDPSTGYLLTDGAGVPLELGEQNGQYMAISVDELEQYAESSTNMWEFLQRFYKDMIVYKNEDGFVYAPVDKTLPLSDYNWDLLVEKGLNSREIEYVENGETKTLKGIDVSRYQNEIDWGKAAADGVEFAFIRLGYRGYSTGSLVLDERFEQNVTGALQNGVAVGVYFVTQAVSEEEAQEEAQLVLDTIAPYNVTWPIVLDIEDVGNDDARTALLTSDQRTDNIIAFCEHIRASGKTPMLYANIRWFVERMDLSRLTAYEKWFAQYFNRPFFPYEFQIWQYTSSGSVAGIEGKVDLNISFVDYGKEE